MDSRPYTIVAHIKPKLGYSIKVKQQPGNVVESVESAIQVYISPTCMTTLVVTFEPTKKANERLVEMVIVFENDRRAEGTKHYLGYFLGTLTGLSLMEERYVLTLPKD